MLTSISGRMISVVRLGNSGRLRTFTYHATTTQGEPFLSCNLFLNEEGFDLTKEKIYIYIICILVFCFLMWPWLGNLLGICCRFLWDACFILLFESDEDKNEVVRGEDDLNELEDWSKVEYVYSYERSWSLYLGLPRLATSYCFVFYSWWWACSMPDFWMSLGKPHLDIWVVVAGSHAALVLCNTLTLMMLLKPSTRWMVRFFSGES